MTYGISMIMPHSKLVFPSCTWLEGAATVRTRKSRKTSEFEKLIKLLLIIFFSRRTPVWEIKPCMFPQN